MKVVPVSLPPKVESLVAVPVVQKLGLIMHVERGPDRINLPSKTFANGYGIVDWDQNLKLVIFAELIW